MAGLNKVILVGNLGADPEIVKFENGDRLATASIATSESWNDKKTGEKKVRTEWHKLVFRGKMTQVVENYVKKGSQILVEGKLATRSYEKDGNKIYTTEIMVNNMTMLGKATEGESSTGSSAVTSTGNREPSASDYTKKVAATSGAPSTSSEDAEELPF